MSAYSLEILPKQPVPVKEGDKYLCIGMTWEAADKEKDLTTGWGCVDFKNSDYSGIYTDGLAVCVALTVIKKSQDGQIEKAWMVHLSGGLNSEQLPEFPEEFDNNFEVIIRYGQDVFLERKTQGNQ